MRHHEVDKLEEHNSGDSATQASLFRAQCIFELGAGPCDANTVVYLGSISCRQRMQVFNRPVRVRLEGSCP